MLGNLTEHHNGGIVIVITSPTLILIIIISVEHPLSYSSMCPEARLESNIALVLVLYYIASSE